MNRYKNENGQKHIILVNLGFREYQNRIQHVNKSVHAKYELCSCQERRVMTILRPPGAKIQEKIGFVAARGCPERRVMTILRPPGAKIQEKLVPANPRSHANFQIFYSISCFLMFNWQPFLDLINSKDCTHEYQLLNFVRSKKGWQNLFQKRNWPVRKKERKKNTFF